MKMICVFAEILLKYQYRIYRRINSCSDHAEVTDVVSCTFVLKHVTNAFVASSILIFSVAWVQTILGFTSANVHHLMIRVCNVAKGCVDRGHGDSIHHKLIVEVFSVVVKATWCHRLSNLWFIFCTKFFLFSHCLFIFFLWIFTMHTMGGLS